MNQQQFNIHEEYIKGFYQKYSFIPFQFTQALECQPPSKFAFNKKKKSAFQQNQKITFNLSNNNKLDNLNFFSICKMLFPEINGQFIPALDIQILDTIFYGNNGNLYYIFNDSKKGLVKLVNKNFYQLFIKRVKELQFQKQKFDKVSVQSTQTYILTPEVSVKESNQIKQHSYIALLRYKDDSYLRLKQNDFKAIFQNPVHANQRFKNINNTQFIQRLPLEKQQESLEDIKNIDFIFQKFKDQQLFILASKISCRQNGSFSNHNISKNIKQKIRKINQLVYLHYLTFEVYAYLSIHYSKKIEYATFTFLKNDVNVFCLANISKIKLTNLSDIKKQYYRCSLLPSHEVVQSEKELPFEQKQNIFGQKTSSLTELQKSIIGYFNYENELIKKNLSQFVNEKFQTVKNPKDVQLSNAIFKILNPNVVGQFSQILSNDQKILNVLNRKSAANKSKKMIKQKNHTVNQKYHQIK